MIKKRKEIKQLNKQVERLSKENKINKKLVSLYSNKYQEGLSSLSIDFLQKLEENLEKLLNTVKQTRLKKVLAAELLKITGKFKQKLSSSSEETQNFVSEMIVDLEGVTDLNRDNFLNIEDDNEELEFPKEFFEFNSSREGNKLMGNLPIKKIKYVREKEKKADDSVVLKTILELLDSNQDIEAIIDGDSFPKKTPKRVLSDNENNKPKEVFAAVPLAAPSRNEDNNQKGEENCMKLLNNSVHFSQEENLLSNCDNFSFEKTDELV